MDKERIKRIAKKSVKAAGREVVDSSKATWKAVKRGYDRSSSAARKAMPKGSSKVPVRKMRIAKRRKVKIKFRGKKPPAPQEAEGNLIGGNQFFKGELDQAKRSMFFDE